MSLITFLKIVFLSWPAAGDKSSNIVLINIILIAFKSFKI